MKLEGYLQKYTNMYKGYQNRYFVLEDQQFSYYKEKVKFQIQGEQPTEILFLKKVHIKNSSKNEKKFKLQINGELFRLQAESINQKQLWIDTITKNSQEISSKQITNQLIKKETVQEQNLYFRIETTNQALQIINPYIKDIWKNIQTLEKEYNYLVLKIQKKTSKLDDELVGLEAIILSQRRLFYALVKCNLFNLAMDNLSELESYKSIENDIDYDEFKSLQDNSDQHINMKHLNQNNFIKKPSRRTVKLRQSEEEDQLIINISFEDLQSGKYQVSYGQSEELSEDNIIEKRKSLKVQAETFEKKKFTCQIKQKLLRENEVFKLFEISNQPTRTCLPAKKDPNIKVSIWQILKDAIGKDITSFSVPIILNEPINMLQRLGEQCEYYDLLNQADKQENSHMRMALVIAFTFSSLGGVINRTTKPFNPLLGETWEFLGDGIKILSEQVSHHPPISAGIKFYLVYAENQHFTYQTNSKVKTKFWGKSLEIISEGFKSINLLKHKDEFIIGQPKSSVYNIMLGKIYVDFYGVINQIQDVTYQNITTGDKGVLTLKQRSWGDKHAYEAVGYIQDKQGNKKLLLEGKWNSHLNVINTQTQESQQIWKRIPVIDENIDYYNFTDFTMNLNHLNQDLLDKIPATDSRLRPDQRGLELQNIPLSQNYKKILEQKQRDRRNEYQKIDKVHVPKWFKQTTNDQKEAEFKYQGGYWEARENGQFGEILDIYQ